MTYNPLDPRLVKAKSKRILEDNEEILKHIIEEEMTKISSGKIDAESSFDLVKKYYTNEGIKEGLRRFMQRLNDYASRDI